nr:MAG TPA: Replication initiation and membrane attachment [Caudoviricetes sp.]
MDYIRQLNTFLNMSAGNLPGTPFNVYMRLFQIANMRGWPERFPASDAEICLMTGIRNKKTIAEARRVLEQAGYIKTIRGGKHQATQYHVVDLVNGVVIGNQNTPITTPITGAITTPITGAITTPITGHYIKHKRKTETKTKTDSAAAADACVREEDNSLSEVVRTFENNIHPVTGKIEQDALIDLTDEYSALWVTEAIKEAALSNGRNLRYITAILERWKREGFKAPRKKGGGRYGTGIRKGDMAGDGAEKSVYAAYFDGDAGAGRGDSSQSSSA